MIASVIQSFFGTAVDEQALLEAFNLDHSDASSRVWLQLADGNLVIHGRIFTRDSSSQQIGEFYRSVEQSPKGLIAWHNSIHIAAEFRRRKIATAHLTKAVRFYDSCGVRLVLMNANDWGPIVWPQLGFDCREKSQIMPIRKRFELLYEAETGSLPAAFPAGLPSLALAVSPGGADLGLIAIREYYTANQEQPIPLMLDLDDKATRKFLEFRGIL